MDQFNYFIMSYMNIAGHQDAYGEILEFAVDTIANTKTKIERSESDLEAWRNKDNDYIHQELVAKCSMAKASL